MDALFSGKVADLAFSTRVIQCVIGGRIHWHLAPGDPPAIPLTSIPRVSLLNPLLYNSVAEKLKSSAGEYPKASHSSSENTHVFAMRNEAYVETSTLFFADQNKENSAFDFEEFVDLANQFLNRLRLYSGQATLPRSISGAIHSPNEIELSREPPDLPAASSSWLLRSYLAEWAVRSQDVINADVGASDPLLVAHGVLLDAVEASTFEDYRRVLLYAAMAVEVLAATTIDAAYDQILVAGMSADRFRVRNYERARGKLELSDAVFVALRRRGKFQDLLHELPLYVLGRSLAAEDQSLFQQGLRLYRTRNKIAHIGQPPAEDKYFPMTADGASEGLQAAFGIFKWFGGSGRCVNPLKKGFVNSKAESG